jgi:hypothetical protein
VDLVCAAKLKRKQPNKEKLIQGEALSAQLVVSRVEDGYGKCLSQWYLLSNVLIVSPETIAIWYYWRWQIESFFKLLKQPGLPVEDWQQESSLAIAKRLLIASHLVRLSGRQMKKNRPVTPSALFEGL